MKLRHAHREELFREARRGGEPHWTSEVCRRLLALVDDPASRVLVADEDGRMLAVLGVTMDRRGAEAERRARIVEVEVDPARSHEGIGSRLVRFAEGIALIEGCLRVDVDPTVERWGGGRCWPSLGYRAPDHRSTFKSLRTRRAPLSA